MIGLFTLLNSITASNEDQNAYIWNQPYLDFEGNRHHQTTTATKAIVWIFILEDCPISNAYSPEFNRLFESYHSKGITFVLIHANPNISVEVAKKHRDDYQLKPTIIFDRDHKWVKYADANVTPEAVLFDAKGKKLYQGRIDDRFPALGKRRSNPTKTDLRDAMDSFLENKPILNPLSKAIGCYIPELTKNP